jgi:hypothetical protein
MASNSVSCNSNISHQASTLTSYLIFSPGVDDIMQGLLKQQNHTVEQYQVMCLRQFLFNSSLVWRDSYRLSFNSNSIKLSNTPSISFVFGNVGEH